MAWTNLPGAITEIRQLMNDGPTDKLRYRQRLIGVQNGLNAYFKTFEFRRVTSFVGATTPVGVYLNYVPTTVISDDLPSGEFQLATIPTDADDLRATFYIQWFTDAEMTEFLTTASEQLGFGSDPTQIPNQFQPSTLKYAAGEGYQKLALFWSSNMSYVYMLSDAPDEKRWDPVKQYQDLADDMRKSAIDL